MKVKKVIFKKCFILQFLIVAIFIIVGFPEFRTVEEFQVNTFTTGNQSHPAVAMDRKGNFVITWVSSGQDGSGHGVFAKLFRKQKEINSNNNTFQYNH